MRQETGHVTANNIRESATRSRSHDSLCQRVAVMKWWRRKEQIDQLAVQATSGRQQAASDARQSTTRLTSAAPTLGGVHLTLTR